MIIHELHNRHTAAKLREVRQEARRLLEDKISSFLEETPDPCRPRLLLLECIKEVDDAYVLLEVLAQFQLPLLQVLFLPTSNALRSALKKQAGAAVYLTQDSRSRDKERRVQERQAKWDANAVQLLEIFSSMSLLTELTAAPAHDPGLGRYLNLRWRPSRQQEHVPELRAPAGSLASLGYAAGPAYTAGNAALGPASASSSAGAAPAWLQQSGLQPPPGLAFTPIQPVVSRRLVVQRTVRDQVLAEAATSSGLKGIVGPGGRLPVPTAAVSSVQQAAWLAYPGRYSVSRKCDGTRHLLIVAADGTPYLKNRSGSLYRYPLVPAGGTGGGSTSASASVLPPGTILDGELVWVGGRGFFLAFDALVIGSERRVWQLPLKARLRLMAEQLQLEEAESSAALRQAAAAAASNSPSPRSSAPRPAPALLKKQQAPANDSITILFKQQHDVSSRTLDKLEASRVACPYPSDGLVFTPCDMPYALGMQELTLKWQPWRQAAADISGTQAQYIDTSRLPSCLVYECLPSTERVYSSYRWQPVSVRWDKAHGNAPALVERMREAWGQPMLEGPAALRQAVGGAEEQLQRAAASGSRSPAAAVVLHPARCLPFGALYSAVLAAVARGTVERTLAEDGLEVFNYTAAALSAAQGPAEQICRGLVLHPATCTVVATPFVRFEQGELGEPAPRPEGPESQSPRPTKKAARSTSPPLWEPPCSPPACASVKVDGSLVIAFLWAGQLRVATRRRLNSEQAVWARGWLHANAQLSGFEPGWTYLFEAVYEDNWVVVPYAFEGLVLLGAVSPAGAQATPEQRSRLAARLGVMPVPCLHGSLHELRSQLPGTGTGSGSEVTSDPAAPAAFEGWVLASPSGGTWHEKQVQRAYKRVSVAAQLMHPQAVWDRVRCGGEPRATLLAGLPPHLRSEMLAMLEALEVSYWGVRDQLQALLQAAGLPVPHRPVGPPHSSAAGGATANSADEQQLRQALAISQLEALVSQMRLEETSNPASSQMELEEGTTLPGAQPLPGVQPPAAASFGMPGRDASSSAPAAAAAAVAASASAGMSAAFLAALDYAALHWSQEDSYTPGTSANCLTCPSRSMFYQTKSTGGLRLGLSNTCKLRGLILDCIKPGPDGRLEGFTPSPNSRQTRAKGWAGGPSAGRLAAPQPLVMEMLPDHSLAEALNLLGGKDVVSGLLVCKAWQAIMAASPDLEAKLEQGKEEAERSRDVMRGDEYEYDGGSYGSGYSYDSYDHGGYRGYGSS